MNSIIYIEGGGDSREVNSRCREGFRKLLTRCNDYARRMPRLVACGGRGAAFDAFKTALVSATARDFVALWIDSEEPLTDLEAAWTHLRGRDQWEKPDGATDEQVLFMTTCMETWIIADRATLAEHYGTDLQESALPPLVDLEKKSRVAVQNALIHATRECANAYSKGKRSFELLGKLDPATLSRSLPSFARVRRILNASL